MNSPSIGNESIQLSLPINAAYVSAARLTASSIANRMLFDIDEIEDIKAAVSEACTFVIKNLPQNIDSGFTIVFSVEKDVLTTTICTEAHLLVKVTLDEMGLVMIRALMDELEIQNEQSEHFKIKMVKKHKAISFD